MQGRDMSWRDRILLCFPDAKINPPALPGQIEKIEKELNRLLPDSLKSALKEADGFSDHTGACIIENLSFLVSDNLDLWSYTDLYMAPTSMLAFGGPGNGDRYFFPILPNNDYKDEVYIWDHEDDSRTWVAQSLRDLLYRLATERTKPGVT